MSTKKHGGKRPGAGRKPLGKVSLRVHIKLETVVSIKARSRRRVARGRFVRGKTTGEVIDDAVALTEIVA